MIIMRDAAHKRISEMVEKKERIPLDFKQKIVFYAGPAKKKAGMVCGAIGPTTSERMDKYLDMMFSLGVEATVGKGARTEFAAQLCGKYGKPYFVAPSGSAAALAYRIKEFEILFFEDLGAEAVQRILVCDFPLMLAIDAEGNDFFKI